MNTCLFNVPTSDENKAVYVCVRGEAAQKPESKTTKWRVLFIPQDSRFSF